MEKKIRAIEKGWGDASVFFTINEKADKDNRVDEIREESKNIGPGSIVVYRGYIGGNIVFEMGASIDVTVYYL